MGFYTVENLFEELEAELSATRRWSFWRERIDAARLRVERMNQALLDQARELEVAANVLEGAGLLSEFRAIAYPKLYRRDCQEQSNQKERK